MSKSEDLRQQKPSECSLLFSTLILTYIYVLIQGDNPDERDGREERPRRRSTLLVPGLGRRARERAEPKKKEGGEGQPWSACCAGPEIMGLYLSCPGKIMQIAEIPC